MSNLLPNEAKIEVWSDTRSRILVGVGLSFFAGAVLAGAALAPSFLIMHGIQVKTSDEKADPTADQTQAILDAQALLSQISAVESTTSPAKIAAQAIAARPRGVTLTHVVYNAGTPATLMLVGNAPRREDVNAYRTALSADPRFSSVSVPINALVGTENGDFTLTITGSF